MGHKTVEQEGQRQVSGSLTSITSVLAAFICLFTLMLPALFTAPLPPCDFACFFLLGRCHGVISLQRRDSCFACHLHLTGDGPTFRSAMCFHGDSRLRAREFI